MTILAPPPALVEALEFKPEFTETLSKHSIGKQYLAFILAFFF